MSGQVSFLVTLIALVDRLPAPPPPPKRGRGRPTTSPDQVFLKALVLLIVRHRHQVHARRTVRDQPTAALARRRALLTRPDGRSPTRRTWARRLAALPATLPAPIACRGRQLVAASRPWAARGRAVAVDRTVLRATGGGWHKQDREAGVVPHTPSATAAHWTTAQRAPGWHGWVDGWQLPLATTVAAAWLPRAAELTPATAADHDSAALRLPARPAEVRCVLGDQHDHAPNVRGRCARADQIRGAAQPGGDPHTGDGVAVRRVVHTRRAAASEHCNEPFQGIFGAHGPVPTNGLANTRRFALGAILVDQLARWHRHEHGLDRRVGRKPALTAA